MNTFQQEDFKVDMVGEVADPPLLVEILDRVSVAAANKVDLLLTPGEARVLSNYLTTLEE